MGFFSDLKEDLNQAVNELLPGGEETEAEIKQETVIVTETKVEPLENKTPEPEAVTETVKPKEPTENVAKEEPQAEDTENEAMEDVDDTLRELEELEGALKDLEALQDTPQSMSISGKAPQSVHDTFAELEREAMAKAAEKKAEEKKAAERQAEAEKKAPEKKMPETKAPEPKPIQSQAPLFKRTPVQENRELRPVSGTTEGVKKVDTNVNVAKTNEDVIDKSWILDLRSMEQMDETAVITAGMRVKGDILSNGSADVFGEVYGNVQVKGKLNVTGKISGNSKAEEILADGAKINGDMISDGPVRVGYGSIVVGNIEGTEAVIAGAVKGMIDVKGPGVIDETAVVLGNVRAKSIQINNGARMEGMCVLCYAEQSAAQFFEEQAQ